MVKCFNGDGNTFSTHLQEKIPSFIIIPHFTQFVGYVRVSGVSCTYCINMVCICHDANSTAAAVHEGDHCPLVGLWAVTLSRLQAFIPIETTTDVNLWGNRKALSHLTLFVGFNW